MSRSGLTELARARSSSVELDVREVNRPIFGPKNLSSGRFTSAAKSSHLGIEARTDAKGRGKDLKTVWRFRRPRWLTWKGTRHIYKVRGKVTAMLLPYVDSLCLRLMHKMM